MESSCSVPEDFLDDFDAPAFENTAAIEWMHSQPPRFGHSNDLLVVIEGSEEEQKDYLKGLILSSIVMFCLFLVWTIVLITCKLLGANRVGILSGTPSKHSHACNGFFMKLVFLCAGISIIISSICMSVKGVSSLTQSLSDGREAIDLAQRLSQDAIDLIDRSVEESERGSAEVERFLETTNSLCPNVRDPICADVSDFSTCNFDGIFEENSLLEQTLQHFSGGQRSIVYEEAVNARDDLETLSVTLNDLDNKAANFNWALYCAMIFSLLLSCLCFYIMVGVISKYRPMSACLRSWVVFPAFILLVVLSFVFSVIFIIGSMTLADLCIDSPDDRILAILNRFEEELSPVTVDFISFYISHCPAELVPQEISDQLKYILDGVPMVFEFTAFVEESSDSLQTLCGFEDPDAFTQAANATNEQLCGIAEVLRDIQIYFQCDNWFPLYETSAYNAMCYAGIDGFAWIASTQFVVVFMAMVLLTFRGVLFYGNEESTNRQGKRSGWEREETGNRFLSRRV